MERRADRIRRHPPKSQGGLRARVARLGRSSRGQGLVEFVLVVPILLVLLFGIYEFSRYYSARLRIRSTVAEAARFAATGNQLTDPVTGDPMSRFLSIRSRILSEVSHFGVTAGDITLSPADGGQPEEAVTVSLNYEYQVAVPLMEQVLGTGTLDFAVSTSMRNELFF